MSDEEEFDAADAGAADSTPIRAGEIKKGGFVVIKGHPCKVCQRGSCASGAARKQARCFVACSRHVPTELLHPLLSLLKLFVLNRFI